MKAKKKEEKKKGKKRKRKSLVSLILPFISNTRDYRNKSVSKVKRIYSPRFTLFHFDFDDEEHATIESKSFCRQVIDKVTFTVENAKHIGPEDKQTPRFSKGVHLLEDDEKFDKLITTSNWASENQTAEVDIQDTGKNDKVSGQVVPFCVAL